jgi:hypothetical protein
MNDNMKSLVWATSLSIPISLLGAFFGFGLAHSEGFIFMIANVLFAPFILFSYIVNDVFGMTLSETVFNTFGLLSRLSGYFLIIKIFRKLMLNKQAENHS